MKYQEQSKIWVAFFILVIVFSLTGCVTPGVKKTPVTVKTVSSGEIEPSISQAVLTVNAAKEGELRFLPFVTTDAGTIININEKPLINVYSEQPLSILQYNVDPNGVNRLVLLRESSGLYGRIDRRLETIVYQTSKPDKSQVKKIRSWLLKQNRMSKKKADKKSREILKDFQKEKGLSPDGQFGPVTAKAMAKEFSMIHVVSIEEKDIYPDVPNHMVFLLSYDDFKKKYAKLPKGFKSWVEISKLAITKEEFKEKAKKGQAYIAFVYFFDRIDPAFKINAEFSTMARSRGEGSAHRTRSDVWPVITKVFTIDDIPDILYLNVFLQKNTFKSPCVGSHQLL